MITKMQLFNDYMSYLTDDSRSRYFLKELSFVQIPPQKLKRSPLAIFTIFTVANIPNDY